MTEWRKLGSRSGGRDPASVLEVVRQAALANRRIRERSHEILSRCRALADQARRDLGAARARVEEAEARAEAAEARARDAETQAEEFERWLNRIEALLTAEFSQGEFLLPPDPLDAVAGELAVKREPLDRGHPGRLARLGWARPGNGEDPPALIEAGTTVRRSDHSLETARPGGVRSAFASLRRRLSGTDSSAGAADGRP
jgi:uncharacterized membrane protein YccC